MRFPATFEEIQRVLGETVPIENVRKICPLLVDALEAEGIYSLPTMIAAIATVAVETGNFMPAKQRGSDKFLAHHDKRRELGNSKPGDGGRFRGRGLIPLTGRENYEHFASALSLPLVENPELALDPANAARILALYFRERGVNVIADAGDWTQVRLKVNIRLSYFSDFLELVNALLALSLHNLSKT